MNTRLAPSQPTVYDPRRWLALSVLLFEFAVYLLSALAMLLLPQIAIAIYGKGSLEPASAER